MPTLIQIQKSGGTVSVLTEAEALVYGDRQDSYGSPLEEYTRVAGMASSLFAKKLKEPLTPEEAVMFMELVKISRFVHDPVRRDNQVDGAGYWAVIEKLQKERLDKIRQPAVDNSNHS